MSDHDEQHPGDNAIPTKRVPIDLDGKSAFPRIEYAEVPAENADDWDERIWH